MDGAGEVHNVSIDPEMDLAALETAAPCTHLSAFYGFALSHSGILAKRNRR